jgi:hypothetical protein
MAIQTAEQVNIQDAMASEDARSIIDPNKDSGTSPPNASADDGIEKNAAAFTTEDENPRTRDTCRDFGPHVTPGELRTKYQDLRKSITVKVDSYVRQARETTSAFDEMMPLIDTMQALLSQRGTLRKLADTVGLPTWTAWFEEFRSSLPEDLNIRSIQRKLNDYRDLDSEMLGPERSDEDEAEADHTNEVATAFIRDIDSRSRVEKLASIIDARNRLNPPIRRDLIRVLHSAAKKLAESATALEKDFPELPTASGKAHQRLVREQRARLYDRRFAEKQKSAADFKNGTVREITYKEAKPLILAHEYLGNLGSPRYCYGLFFGKHLASVVCFGSTAGTHLNAAVCGPEHADKVVTLIRGASEPWCDQPITSSTGEQHASPAASHLISEACNRLAARGKNIVVAFADPKGSEIGQIYQSANFLYTGRTSPSEQFVTPEGKTKDARGVHGLTRDRRNRRVLRDLLSKGITEYKGQPILGSPQEPYVQSMSRQEMKAKLESEGYKFVKGNGKHRYVYFAGNKRIKRLLLKALNPTWKEQPHPKRAGESKATPVVPPQEIGFDPQLPLQTAKPEPLSVTLDTDAFNGVR